MRDALMRAKRQMMKFDLTQAVLPLESVFLGCTVVTLRSETLLYINTSYYQGWTPLHVACKAHGRASFLSFLLERGADARAKTAAGSTLLHVAAQGAHRQVGSVYGPPGSTPAHYGTKPGHFETSKIHFPTSEGVSE